MREDFQKRGWMVKLKYYQDALLMGVALMSVIYSPQIYLNYALLVILRYHRKYYILYIDRTALLCHASVEAHYKRCELSY